MSDSLVMFDSYCRHCTTPIFRSEIDRRYRHLDTGRLRCREGGRTAALAVDHPKARLGGEA